MRAAIYARYSSGLQHIESLTDQETACREYVVRTLRSEVVAVYSDAARSGKTAHRPDFQRMIRDAAKGFFDAVICYSIDRLGRRLADVADLRDTLEHHNVELHSPTIGKITSMHVAIFGFMAEEQIKRTAMSTRDGQAGRVVEGYVAGGLGFGYRALPKRKEGKTEYGGEREIIEAEAEIVRRIFREFASGESPDRIARRLNEEGIPGPRGNQWQTTTIRGQAKRGNGILNNESYVGRIVWNRTAYRTNPKTGKREARPNPPKKWVVSEAAHLRIVDDDLWTRVKVRQAGLRARAEASGQVPGIAGGGGALNATHRPNYLFSGLLTCACCGGSYTIVGKDRYGCANPRNGRTLCTNSKTVGRRIIERRVLNGLRDGLLTEENIRVFVQEMQTEARKARETERADRTRLEQELKAADASIAALIDLIEQGKAPPSVVERITERESERDRLRARLDALGTEPDVVELHPNAAALYARKVDDLAAALNEPAIATDAKDLLRSLVKTVVIEPDPNAPDGVALTVHGALAEVLALCQGTKPRRNNPRGRGHGGSAIGQLSVVAGAGFEPATFRL